MKVSKPVLFTLIGAIVFAVYLFFFAGPKKAPPPKMPPSPDVAKLAAQAAQQTTEKRPDDIRKISRYDASWDRDPFLVPKLMTEKTLEKPYIPLKLVAIIESRQGRYAIFGNEIVKKGDTIGEERVYEVGKDRVILVRKGQRRVVPVADAMEIDSLKPSSMEEKR